MGLFDVHAHLTDARLAAIEDDLIARAASAGVTTIVSNGLHLDDNQAVLALAERQPMVKPALGLYPVNAVLVQMQAAGVDYPSDGPARPAAQTLEWLRENGSKGVAIGEIGLDRYWVPEQFWEEQERVFVELVRIAQAFDKPIIIHSRKAERRCFELLKELNFTRVNWHCYSSKVKLGCQFAAHGHWLSIPANVRRAENFLRLVQKLPRDKVLLETDCPYLSPEKGTLSESAYVKGTVDCIAEQWSEPVEKVVDQLEDNFEALFGFRP